ncbi:MAG TPA: alternative ribosome rescue aminoacyl-tRNA hydrolase ArfB [Flavitalea sp.]|nr:alternative ribosome rescue aminoacyl-tRNA hydrolase ArfB [Flavitalea sp.]
MDVLSEIRFQTARSGGKGGQNVNKVETMVEGYFHVGDSQLLTDEQKKRVHARLINKINAEGCLLVKSQVHRSQLSNKAEVVKKINALLLNALKKEKKRIPTKPSKASKERRIESKKKNSEAKSNRQKFRF